MNVGIIGLGYWGPNLVRNFLAQKNVEKVIAFDQRAERLDIIKTKSPFVSVTKSFEDMLKSDIDAVVIATPVQAHFSFAKQALEAGKHIWVEKPFTSTSQQAEELLELADKKNLRIFVDHTFIYTGAVRKMKEIVVKGELGKILHFDSVRINLGLFQQDINVIWDLAPHDLSIMNYVLSDLKPTAVSANGIANYNGKENIAHISLYFEENCFAHFHVNWTSPVKIRRMIVGGDKKMLVFDDMENFEKIKVYDAGVDIKNTASIYEALVQYRLGDMYSPKVMQTEALELAAKEFLDSINENRDPLTSGKDGLEVVKILEVADLSLQNKGQLFDINSRVMV
ncbi:MAG: oxidoreductase [Ignavibacteria bacterium RIFOXYA12_FULL_35_25]|nr:MAG: oxidoreductase [Ignavibacteria bacterium GWF2_35_20]OGU87879.1 MAG: oxidoreductase [Ignavibacteria bacterium RIFOXYA12_FULL_35_25]OGV28743.1 MAG: oxidoreductase [Ignavibacteria bacterium RIFOXYD12_FULL_36_8]